SNRPRHRLCESAMRRFRLNLHRTCRALFVVALAIVVTVFWVVGSFVNRLTKYGPVARTLPQELAQARAEGLPLDPDDLRRSQAIPDSQNAAILYRKLGKLLPKNKEEERKKLNGWLKDRTPTNIAQIRALLVKR